MLRTATPRPLASAAPPLPPVQKSIRLGIWLLFPTSRKADDWQRSRQTAVRDGVAAMLTGWTHVNWREDLHIGVVICASSCEFGKAEVSQPDFAARIKEQVVGVQVPMNDALQVGLAADLQLYVGKTRHPLSAVRDRLAWAWMCAKPDSICLTTCTTTDLSIAVRHSISTGFAQPITNRLDLGR
jgi:hypothetical protein